MMQIIGRGQDPLGKFTVAMPGACEVCAGLHTLKTVPVNARVDAVVQYDRKPKPYKQIQPEATILNVGSLTKPRMVRQIGITCGCYGKLHRQYAHIEDSMETNRQSAAKRTQKQGKKR
jgi:hypothetical protein